jgi:hypothetical protein
MSNTRVKINLLTGEIELEGSETFVENQLENLDSIVELLLAAKGEQLDDEMEVEELEDAASSNGTVSNSNPVAPKELEMPSSFGEWMHKFRDDIDGNDKALFTAYYVQKQSPQNDFKTREVNNSLKEHGIKLPNPSESLKRLVAKKLIFQTRKNGTVKFFRVSQDGLQHLKSLLRQ